MSRLSSERHPRPGRRAFHSSSPFGLHAASPLLRSGLLLRRGAPPRGTLTSLSCTMALTPLPRERTAQRRPYPTRLRNRRRPRTVPGQRWRSASSLGESRRTPFGAVLQRRPFLALDRAALRSCVRRALREGARVRGGRSPEFARPAGRGKRVSPPEADARDRTPRDDLRSQTIERRAKSCEVTLPNARTRALARYFPTTLLRMVISRDRSRSARNIASAWAPSAGSSITASSS